MDRHRRRPPASRSARPRGRDEGPLPPPPGDPASPGRGAVLALLVDRSGNLWIGTESGLDRLAAPPGNPGTGGSASFVHYRHDPDDPDSPSRGPVQAILEDRDGGLWIGTDGGGLDRFDRLRQRFEHYRHDPQDPSSLGSDRVTALVEDRSGTIWIGTDSGLDRAVPDRGVVRFEHHRHDPQDPASLVDDFVRSLLVDRCGALWVGTWAGGVSRFAPDRGRFLTLRHDPSDPASLSREPVTSVYEDRAGALWVGTMAGLDRFAPEAGGFVHYLPDPADPRSLSSGIVTAIAEDRAGALWVGSFGGLHRLLDRRSGGEGFTVYRHDPADPRSLSEDRVLALLEDRAGTLWIGTFGGGLNRWRGEGFDHFRHDRSDPASLGGDRVRCLYEDRDRVLWIGTTDGLHRLDPSRQSFAGYRHDPSDPASLSHDYVLAIHPARGGGLWIGTAGGGLNHFQAGDSSAGVFTRVTMADGLPNNHVYAILEDGDGRLWLSTNRGLCRFDPQTRHVTSYDLEDGIQGFEFTQCAGHRGADGTMYFGGVHGLNVFHPSWFAAPSEPPLVVLTDFRVFERQAAGRLAVSTLEAVELGYQDNFFSFEFAALSYTRPDKSRYAYRLEGLDEDWIEAGDRRYASYTSVSPGEYVFRVRAANREGVWNEEGASLKIVLRPPWWQAWWFRAAGLAVLAGLLWTAHRVRLGVHQRRAEREKAVERRRLIAELRAKNTELERFTYTVSHDLKAPIVTMKGFLGFLKRDLAAGNAERVERDVERIEGAAEKMRVQVEDLLSLSRVGRTTHPTEDVPFGDLVAEAREMIAIESRERGVEIEVAPGLPVVHGDRARLVEAVHNLLENAVKYMGDQSSPRVEVGWRSAGGNGEAVLYVRDNGSGIEPSYHDKVFELFQRLDAGAEGSGVGLALVKRIVEVHGGRIWVESEGGGRGSTFCFTLPGGDAAGGEDR